MMPGSISELIIENATMLVLFVSSDISSPVYFGHKEQVTDEPGVFDVARAELLSMT